MNSRKKIIQFIVFLAIMLLTFYAVFRKQELPEIWAAVTQMSWGYVMAALLLGLFFVSAEGIMMKYLFASMGEESNMCRCLLYSWVGFFYSGITPSATGGQPMQLYYMKKDGHKASDATVILMTMALVYKLVLVVAGIGILALWYQPLKSYMKGYMLFYFVGIFLNLGVVLIIIGVMLFPAILIKCANVFDTLMIWLHIWKVNPDRQTKVQGFVESYRHAVGFMIKHRIQLMVIIVITILQRASMLLLTYLVYCGFHLHGEGMGKIMVLQAAVYITVDMLPIPGAQGITELVYKTVFSGIFTEFYLVPSMMVSRGMNFYIPLLICAVAAIWAAYGTSNQKVIYNMYKDK